MGHVTQSNEELVPTFDHALTQVSVCPLQVHGNAHSLVLERQEGHRTRDGIGLCGHHCGCAGSHRCDSNGWRRQVKVPGCPTLCLPFLCLRGPLRFVLSSVRSLNVSVLGLLVQARQRRWGEEATDGDDECELVLYFLCFSCPFSSAFLV